MLISWIKLYTILVVVCEFLKEIFCRETDFSKYGRLRDLIPSLVGFRLIKVISVSDCLVIDEVVI